MQKEETDDDDFHVSAEKAGPEESRGKVRPYRVVVADREWEAGTATS